MLCCLNQSNRLSAKSFSCNRVHWRRWLEKHHVNWCPLNKTKTNLLSSAFSKMDFELQEEPETLSLNISNVTGREESDKNEEKDLSRKETFDELLIMCVRQNPILYNSDLRDHKDREKRELTWRAVGCTLKASASRSERRWRCLRDKYVKEKKKVKRLRDSGVELPKPWHHMASLSFLKEFVHHRRTSEHDRTQPVTSASPDHSEDVDEPPSPNSNSCAEGPSLSTTTDNNSSSQPATIGEHLPSLMRSRVAASRSVKKKSEKDFLEALNSNAELLSSVQGPPMSSLQLFLLSLVERIEKLPEDLVEEFQFQTLSCIRKLRREAQDRGDF